MLGRTHQESRRWPPHILSGHTATPKPHHSEGLTPALRRRFYLIRVSARYSSEARQPLLGGVQQFGRDDQTSSLDSGGVSDSEAGTEIGMLLTWANVTMSRGCVLYVSKRVTPRTAHTACQACDQRQREAEGYVVTTD